MSNTLIASCCYLSVQYSLSEAEQGAEVEAQAVLAGYHDITSYVSYGHDMATTYTLWP
jgi:hypothetical protein